METQEVRLRELWEHQKAALRKQQSLPAQDAQASSFALLMDVGTGKSGASIAIWRARANALKQLPRTLIFCPPVVCPKWKKELGLFSKVDQGKVILLDGSGKDRLKKFRQHAFPEGNRRGCIFITNYESVLMPDLFSMFVLWLPESLILDESHELKNHKAKRSKKIEQLANGLPVIPHKQILTGSPMLNKGGEDLFHQYLVLDGGMTFGRNFYIFQSKYFRDRNAGMPAQRYFPKWEIMTLEKDGFDAKAAMEAAMAPRTFVARKQDCLDLPPLVEETILLPMMPEQARLYKEMKQDFVAYLGDKACVATMAMTKALRLLQISSGYIKTTDEQEVLLGETPKMKALEDLLEQITPHSKVLVWAAYKANYAQIRAVMEKLNIKYVEIHGDISPSKKQDAMNALNNDPEVGALIGHPGAGGVGIDLIQASYSITYSRTSSIKHKVQKDGRNYRGGSEIHEKITQIDLVCENTIDELVTKSLQAGIEFSTAMLKGLALQLMEQD